MTRGHVSPPGSDRLPVSATSATDSRQQQVVHDNVFTVIISAGADFDMSRLRRFS